MEEKRNEYSALTSSNNSLAASLKEDSKNYDVKKVERNAKIIKIVTSILTYTFLILLAIIVIFPFYWMLNSLLKSLTEYQLTKPTFIPKQFVWSNYVEAFTTANLGTLFINTLYVGLISTLLSLVITVLSAFAFARLEFKGRDSIFAFMLATMMIPGELFTITNYATVTVTLKWGNTFTALIVPFLVSVFYIYLLRQNFMQVSDSLYLAAKVDGTSDFGYLTKVLIPLSKPTIISIIILKLIECWNSFVWPRLITTNSDYYLVSNGIEQIKSGGFGRENIPAMMAAVVSVSVPLLILFVLFRKQIMSGVARSGTKG